MPPIPATAPAPHRRTIPTLNTAAALGLLCLSALLLPACRQGNFAADLTNQTPQPVYAQLFTRANDLNGSVLSAQTRLGPGDRGFLGPVRTAGRNGQVYLAVDFKPNASDPVTRDLAPGTEFFEIHQEGEGTPARLRIDRKP